MELPAQTSIIDHIDAEIALEALTPAEGQRLQELETRIEERSRSFFVETAEDYREIRDGKLYRETHKRFEDYCQERWEMTRSPINRLIRCIDTLGNLVPIGTKLPVNEFQMRPLHCLKEPEIQRAAWGEVVERAEAEEGEITAAMVADVVQDVKNLQKEAPDLMEAVTAGEMGLAEATTEMSKRPRKETTSRRSSSRAPSVILPPSRLPEGKYSVLWADPPWAHDFNRQEASRAECRDYRPMSTPSICDHSLDGERVIDKAASDAVLFLWSTPSRLPEALHVMHAWGFRYESQLVWIKSRKADGPGIWVRADHELLLIGTHGDPNIPEPITRPSSVVEAPKRANGVRPVRFYEIAERMLPKATRLLVFGGSQPRRGWEAWTRRTDLITEAGR